MYVHVYLCVLKCIISLLKNMDKEVIIVLKAQRHHAIKLAQSFNIPELQD